MITGIFGVIILLMSMISQNLSWSNFKIVLGIILYAFIAYSGYLLMYKPGKGIIVSVIAQLLQTVMIKIQGLLYGITASAYIYLSIGKEGLKLVPDLKVVEYYPAVSSLGNTPVVYIYLIPPVLILLLLMKKK